MRVDPTPTFVEIELSWLISRSGITQARPDRRLNAIENTACALLLRWRGAEPIVPERELRMSDATRDDLLAWIEEREQTSGETRARITIYSSSAVADPSVPDGWIRVLVRGAR